MKNQIAILCFVIFIMPSILYAGDVGWSSTEAKTIAQGCWETGVFGPLRYGYSDRIEFSMHPIAAFLIPNFSVIISHHIHHELITATRHSFVYPTPLLRTITREGTGGIIAPDPTIPKIPHMFSFSNEILITREFREVCSLTGKLSFSFAFRTSELDSRTTIDLPLVFPRLEVYYHGFGVNYGIDLQKSLSQRFVSAVSAELTTFPGGDECCFFDQRTKIFWNLSARCRLAVGYILTYGKYPFGTQWHLLPYVDLFVVIKQKKK